VVPISTTGDGIQDRPLAEAGGKGLFVKEIEEALLAKRIDAAVHSMKDMPTVQPDGLAIAAFLPREDARDVLIASAARRIAGLKRGAVVGTSALRRKAQLLHRRPDLRIVDMRGNVDTRLAKCRAGTVEATLLALAGLKRLGLSDAGAPISEDEMLPAVGQGAICIECRADDAEVRALLAGSHDAEAAIRVTTERAVLDALGGDCKTPLGAYAERVGSSLRVRAFVADADGSNLRQGERNVPWPRDEAEARANGQELGRSLGVRG